MKSLLIPVALASMTALSLPFETAMAQPAVRIEPTEQWDGVFGDSEVTFHFEVTSGKNRRGGAGRIQWLHAANQRTISRGESEYRPGDSAEIALRVPPVNDGVIFRTTLTVDFVPTGADSAAATLEKTIWVFPEDPFDDQRKSFGKESIQLFDPNRRTSDLFNQIELPHQAVSNAAALDDAKSGAIIIVGEGTSLSRNRGLAERLLDRAASGCRVLMLAPFDGNIPLPDSNAGELRLRKQHVIRDLDKRLDADAWPEAVSLPGTRIGIATRLSRAIVDVSEDGDWPWMEVRYPDSRGVFLVCGYSVIEHWDHGPTPRFLLARILQKLQRD